MKTNKSRKRLCSALLCLILTVSMLPITGYATEEKIAINEENFPDAAFRAYITKFDTDKNNSLSQEEIESVQTISLSGGVYPNLSSLDGIQHFTSLNSLWLTSIKERNLKLGNNAKLGYLMCQSTDLSLLKMDGFTNLNELACQRNTSLQKIVFGALTNLKKITYTENKGPLETLDVSGLTGLTEMDCSENKNLNQITFSNNSALKKILCYENPSLRSLDVSGLTALQELVCNFSDGVGGGALISLTLGNNPALTTVNCKKNKITSLDISGLGNLVTLKCDNNSLKNITFANNDALTTLTCSGNTELESLDISTLTALQTLECSGSMSDMGKGFLNSLTFGDKNINLKELDCSNNSLTSLELSKLTGLTQLTCGNNDMKSLDVSVLAKLKTLDCSAYSFGGDKGSLTSLVFGDTNTNLTNVGCSNNQLTSLNVSRLSKLTSLDCRNNQLTSLNVSRLSKLTSLDCSNNQLTSLDVSGLANLNWLSCDGNEYTIQVGRDGKFDLSNLPTGFDVNRVTQWTNASVEQKDGRNMLKVDDNASEVTYTYNCSGETNGNPKFTATFTLLVEKEQTYAINVENDGNGTASASVASVEVASAAQSEQVTLTAAPNEGYEFDKWVVEDNKVTLANPNSPTTTFTMPASEVTIKVSFKKKVASGGSSGGGAYVPSTPPAPSNPKPFGSAITSDVSGSTSRKDGETSTKVDQSTADKLVDAAIDNKSTDIVIDTASKTENGGVPNVKASEVTLPTETIKNIAEKTDASLTIKTDVGEIKLDNKAAASVSKQGENTSAPGEQETISIIAKKVKEDTEEVRYELQIKNFGGKTISDFRGGTATITVPVPSGLQGESLICVYIDKKGHYNKVKGKWTADGRYAFSTGHFSTYAMMREITADTVIAKQKAAVRKMTMEVRTKIIKTKSGKQAIRVTWTSGGKIIPDGVQIYRSTKKGGSFGKKPIFTTEKTRYLNTAVKTGQRYYYKVRGYVTIDGETVYSKLSGKGNRKLPETV